MAQKYERNFGLVGRRKRSSHRGPLIRGGFPRNNIIFIYAGFVYDRRAGATVH